MVEKGHIKVEYDERFIKSTKPVKHEARCIRCKAILQLTIDPPKIERCKCMDGIL